MQRSRPVAGQVNESLTLAESIHDRERNVRVPPGASPAPAASPAPGASPALNGRLLDYREVVGPGTVSSSARDAVRAALLALADLLSLTLATAVTSFASPLPGSAYRLLIVLGCWLALNALLGLYRWDSAVIDKSTLREIPRLAQSLLIGILAVLVFGSAIGLQVNRYGAIAFAAVALLTMLATRSLVRGSVWRLCGPERALIVGSGEVARLICRKLKTHASYYGIEIIGYVDDQAGERPGSEGAVLLGDMRSLHRLCREQNIERLIVAFSRLDHGHLLDAVRAGKALGIKVTVVPRLYEVLGRSMVVDDLEGMSVLSLPGVARSRLSLAAKRTIDVAGSLGALLLLSPLMALIVLAIKLDSKGPAIFSQVRIGRANKPFRLRKFRTMVQDAERFKAQIAELNEVELPLLKIPEDRDPRLTRVGRVLRRTMLDELPQLWNVLRGEMSLVGPRPLEPQDDAEVLGWYRARLELTPGLTGPWQALGRHAIPFREMVTLDYLYVVHWSLSHDLKLMFRTLQLMLRMKRA